jgi:hypothetical protein
LDEVTEVPAVQMPVTVPPIPPAASQYPPMDVVPPFPPAVGEAAPTPANPAAPIVTGQDTKSSVPPLT